MGLPIDKAAPILASPPEQKAVELTGVIHSANTPYGM
jgi:flagellar motility protein MotE (MotC chaperone)